MEKLPFFRFKERSSLDFGLYIKEKGVYKGAKRRLTYTPVPGRNGDLITDEGSYENVRIPYKLELLNSSPRSFEELALLLKNWLTHEPGYHKLWDTYDRGYYRLASFSDEVNPEQELRDYGKLDITFNCKPLRYAVNGDNVVSITAATHLYNAETEPSSPYIKLFGNGSLIVYINGDQYKVNDVNGYVEIDSETMCCYSGATSMNNKMISDGFPTFVPGDNTITLGTNVTKIDIIPRWCAL